MAPPKVGELLNKHHRTVFFVSDGTGKPHKCRVRSPCFAIMQALDDVLLPGATIADVVPIFGSVNMIGGECDR